MLTGELKAKEKITLRSHCHKETSVDMQHAHRRIIALTDMRVHVKGFASATY